MSRVIFKTDVGRMHTFDSLHFYNYFANANTEKQILEALDSPFLGKGSYTIEWDMMSADNVTHMATILLDVSVVGGVIEPIDKIEKYKVVCKEADIPTNITWKEDGKKRTRAKTREEMRDDLVIKQLREKIESYMSTKKHVIHSRILKIRLEEEAARRAERTFA